MTPGKGRGSKKPAPALLIEETDGHSLGAIEDGLPDLRGSSLKGSVNGEMIVLLQGLQHLLVPQGVAVAQGRTAPCRRLQIGVGDHQVGVDDQPGAQPATAGRPPGGC